MCQGCEGCYLGETKRKLAVTCRVKEHKADVDNTVRTECTHGRNGNNQRLREQSLPSQIMCVKLQTNHLIDWDSARMVERE